MPFVPVSSLQRPISAIRPTRPTRPSWGRCGKTIYAEKIVFQDADEKGRNWKKYLPLKAALEQISNAQHRSETGNFRNAFQHQMPPHLAMGLSGLMQRTVDPKTGEARYEAGETQPLGVGDIATALASQAEACRTAFSRFQELVREHEAEIIRANTEDDEAAAV